LWNHFPATVGTGDAISNLPPPVPIFIGILPGRYGDRNLYQLILVFVGTGLHFQSIPNFTRAAYI
jgi:hypothetical protein